MIFEDDTRNHCLAVGGLRDFEPKMSLFKSLILIIHLLFVPQVGEVFEEALAFWNGRTLFQKFLIGMPIIFIIANILGLE
jgi:hypothetical protein